MDKPASIADYESPYAYLPSRERLLSSSVSPLAPSRKAGLFAVYATVFLDLLGFGIIIPLMPYAARTFGASGLMLGALMTAYSAAQFVGAPIMGRLSDRYGRRPVILTTLAGSVAAMTLMGVADGLGLIFVARLGAGLCGGSISAAQAYVADVTAPAERAKFMGLLGASIGMGFVFGPALGAALANYGFSGAAFVAAGLAAANWVFAYVKLKEPVRAPDASGAARKASVGALFEALGRGSIRPILIAGFLVTFGMVAMEATFALLAADRFAVDARTLGLLFTLSGVVVAIVQGGLIGRLSKQFGEGKLAVTGPVVMAIGLAAIGIAPTLTGAVLALCVMAFGQAMASPALTSLLSLNADAHEQGSVIGLGQGMSALARAVGPLVAGALYDQHISWPYWCGAAAALLATAVIFPLRGAGAARTQAAAIRNR